MKQMKAISLDHPFLSSQRNQNKYCFYYLQRKKGRRRKKKRLLISYFSSKLMQQVVPVFWLGLGLFGLQCSLHRPEGIYNCPLEKAPTTEL